MKKVVLIALLAVMMVSVFGYRYFYQKVSLNGPIAFEVKKGEGLYSIIHRLGDNSVIENPWFLAKIGQVLGYGKKVKFGKYNITPGMTYEEVLQFLTTGQAEQKSFVFIEGSHIYDLAQILENKGISTQKEVLELVNNREVVSELLGDPQVTSLEGYLFPDTYFFLETDSAKIIVKKMVDNFLAKAQELNFSHKSLSRHELLTMASIVEKETGASFERPLISSVFHNRLKKGMRLETDPTIIYGVLRQTGKEIKNIRKKHLQEKTAYNTYKIRGLPPGPIGNPGYEALYAAMHPKKSEFLYFVSKNDGTSMFSKNYEDHKKAVKTYQLNTKMRKGKSWRDLKKRATQ